MFCVRVCEVKLVSWLLVWARIITSLCTLHTVHAVFMLPEKGVSSTVVWTVHRWYLDCPAGPEESSTSEVERLQKFCRRKLNCKVFAAPRSRNASWRQRARAPSAVGHESNDQYRAPSLHGYTVRVIIYTFCGFSFMHGNFCQTSTGKFYINNLQHAVAYRFLIF